jgi:hypothetical protein
MPARDGTGPFGQGRMTGRRRGMCAIPGESSLMPGRGRGLGMRLGRGGIGLGLGLGCLRFLMNTKKNEPETQDVLEKREAMIDQVLAEARSRIARFGGAR